MAEYIVRVSDEIREDGSQKIEEKKPLVRCKDCKYQTDKGRKYKECDKHFLWAKNDWFCADGEVKDGQD